MSRTRRWRFFGVLTMAPWWRGPFLLLRRPGVAGALLAASVVATLPAASAIPFLSSSRNATLHHQIAASCPWTVGVTVNAHLGQPRGAGQPGLDTPPADDFGSIDFDYDGAVARRNAQTSAAAASVPLLGPSQTTLISPQVRGPTERPDSPTYPMYVVHRQGFQDHLELVAGSRDAAVWVPDVYAEFIGLRAGGDLHLNRFFDEGTTLTDVAIYRSLREQPHQPFWCDLQSIYAQPAGNNPAPEVIFVDQESFLALPQFWLPEATHRTMFPLTDPLLDMDAARVTVQQIEAVSEQLAEPQDDDAFGGDNHVVVLTRLPAIAARSDLVRESLFHPVAPIAAAGVLVGLVVVGAAATYWVSRRRHELVMLAAHGVGSGALAMKAVMEALPSLAAGSVLGWAGGWLLVRWAGPDPALSGEAVPWAATLAGATLLVQIVTVGLVAGLASRPLADQVRTHHRSVLRRLPYELLVLAAAPVAWSWLGGESESAAEDPTIGTVIHVPGRLLVVPIMVVAGLTILLARVTVAVLRRSRTKWTPRRTATFLGWRRVSRQAVMVAILASATSMPVALAIFGSVVTQSVRTTVQDESRLHIGTDVVVLLNEEAAIPPALADQATIVQRIDGLRIGGVAADLLVVDPAGFERTAYWHDSLGHTSMHDLLAPLRDPTSGPTVVAAGKVPMGPQPATYGGRKVLGGTVEVVTTRVLPAQLGGYPVALLPRSALGDLEGLGRKEIWIRGDSTQILTEISSVDLPMRWIYVAADNYANTLWEPLTYTFDYLTALSLLTGVVTLVGLQLYLEAQTPLRRRAYVLLRRMGLSKGSHRRALLGELALPLLAGLLGGIAMTAALVATVNRTFDLNPRILPDTVIDVPYVAIGVITAMAVLVGVVAAGYAQARIGRAQPSEVLRDAD